MKNKLLLLLFVCLTLPAATAVELQESCLDVRSFSCSFSYKLKDGTEVSGSAAMEDFKYKFAGESCEVYQSKLVLRSDKIVAVYATENDNNANDVEEVRDDEPNGRSGWGGKQFYLALSGKTAIMTIAKREQIGKSVRDYSLLLLDENDDGDLLKKVGQGTMTCNVVE